MKLAYFDAAPADRQALAEALPDITTVVVTDPLNSEGVLGDVADAEIVSVFVSSKVDRATLDQLPQVKLIAARSAGYDHIDVAACQERGIAVVNVPVYGDNTVAEHTFALILALSRKIFQSYERTERMNFDRTGLEGFDLRHKTIGIVGLGNIGRRCARIAMGFEMKVIAYDTNPDTDAAAELGVTLASSLEELLAGSDIISLHVPQAPGATPLIHRENIRLCKKGGLLINTARGGLVDSAALLWALDQGILVGAGLDVLEEERDVHEDIELLADGFARDKDIATILRNHILVQRHDVIITPHNAFNSREAVQRIFDTTIENIQAFTTDTPTNVVS